MRKFKRGAKKFKKTRPVDIDFEIVWPMTFQQRIQAMEKMGLFWSGRVFNHPGDNYD